MVQSARFGALDGLLGSEVGAWIVVGYSLVGAQVGGFGGFVLRSASLLAVYFVAVGLASLVAALVVPLGLVSFGTIGF